MCEILCTFTVCFYYYKDWCYVMNSPAFVRLCDEKVPYTHPSIEGGPPPAYDTNIYKCQVQFVL